LRSSTDIEIEMRTLLSSVCIGYRIFGSIVVENLAVLSMWGGDWYDFYIVEKDNDAPDEASVTV
jgi:hypothetical protein